MNKSSKADAQYDRVAIREVLERYCSAIDRRDFALLESCFTPDLSVSYLDGAFSFGSLSAFMEWMQSPLEYGHSLHSIAHVHTEVSGDTATADQYTMAVLCYGQDGRTALLRGVRYLDTLRREDGEWRICEREHRSLWQVTAPEEAIPLVVAGQTQ